jgi:hypothetical protein
MYILKYENKRYNVEECIKIFGIIIYKKTIGSFPDAEQAINHLKSKR